MQTKMQFNVFLLCTYQCIAPGTPLRAKGGDLTSMKSNAYPPGANTVIICPLRTVYFHPIISKY